MKIKSCNNLAPSRLNFKRLPIPFGTGCILVESVSVARVLVPLLTRTPWRTPRESTLSITRTRHGRFVRERKSLPCPPSVCAARPRRSDSYRSDTHAYACDMALQQCVPAAAHLRMYRGDRRSATGTAGQRTHVCNHSYLRPSGHPRQRLSQLRPYYSAAHTCVLPIVGRLQPAASSSHRPVAQPCSCQVQLLELPRWQRNKPAPSHLRS